MSREFRYLLLLFPSRYIVRSVGTISEFAELLSICSRRRHRFREKLCIM